MKFELGSIKIKDWPFNLIGIAYGKGSRLQLEVIYSEHTSNPSTTQLRSVWKTRQDRRGVPLLVVVLYDNKAHVCGPSGEDPTVYPNLDPGQVERVCQEALEQQSRQAALRSLRDSLHALSEDGIPGLRNKGFLASHELKSGVPSRSDWESANSKGRSAIQHTGKDLLASLGFSIEKLDKITDVLRSGDQKKAIAVLLNERETPESSSDRIPGELSPVSYALSRADDENLDWVVLLHGRKIRLYPVKMDVGVGRRGRTETFLECHTGLIPDDQAAYLWLLFSAKALASDGSLESILNDSRDFAGDLAARLRERIYDEVIPQLAEGLAVARGIKNPSAEDLSVTYQMAMRVLFRLLFVAYGEDKDLLPYRFNGLYQKRSLKTKAKELVNLTPNDFKEGKYWWQETKAIFHAVDKGNSSWGVPAYNGGLFSSDPKESPIGAKLERVSLPDSVFGPVLQQLLLVPTAEDILGPVDFRSLGVREFGTIYEGLLESELSVAETDLTVEAKGKRKDSYRPCKKNEEPLIPKGRVYLHNSSGARKSTGSYYTKPFAVEHLLDKSLNPAIDNHFERIDKLDDLEAAESFFDFRVADIAMGSGHFLVAAIDRIEARFSGYLAKRSLPYVARELDDLRKAALESLGDAASSYPEFEDNALLRRQIARRCIYGVDINEVAVQLARLGIWIHTFVPGLPLSLLDRNLVHGNSLIGIGQLDEVREVLEQHKLWAWFGELDEWLQEARKPLAKLGKMADATSAELREARKVWKETEKAVAPLAALCSVVTHNRIKGGALFERPNRKWKDQHNLLLDTPEVKSAGVFLVDMDALHFPIAFPEVFLRKRSGFDVILGNPPWEKARVEEHGFWARYVPGLRGLSQREREVEITLLRRARPDLVAELEVEVERAKALRLALSRGPFPGMGTGDPDLYKAFCWRFWFLVTKTSGFIGVVLPRSVLAAKGSEEFRWKILGTASGLDVVTLKNKAGWIFTDVTPQYTITLVSIMREEDSTSNSQIYLEGPFSSQIEYETRQENGGASFIGEDVLNWNDSASLPLLPTTESVDVFLKLRRAPRLDLSSSNHWRARPHRELDATNDKPLMDVKSTLCPDGFWPVYKGASFNLWEPDTGKYYAWADPDIVTPVLQKKRLRGNISKKSVFYECNADKCADPSTLHCRFPRLAFRDVARATDKRTVICALVPPEVFVNNTAPYFVFPNGSLMDTVYLLGVMSSIVLDWYARRFVETHVTFFVINPFPIPRPSKVNSLRKRVIELAGRLACPDERFAEWAKEVGVNCGPLDSDVKQDMIYELDAVVAHLYDLNQKQLSYIYETFYLGWDYNERLKATLNHFRKWKKSI
jgi:hypothetical protein